MSNKTAVLYKSKYGASRTYAKWIADKLHCDFYNITNISLYNLYDYDLIVFVSALYAGKLSAIRNIRKIYKKLNGNKNLYCVIVGFTDTSDEIFYNSAVKQNFSSDEIENMQFYFLRGAIDFNKLKLHHALMMYMLKRIISNKTVKTEDEKFLLENYGKKIDFTKKSSVEKIILDIKNKSK